MLWIKWTAPGLAWLAVLAAAVSACGARRWASATRALVERLEGGRVPLVPARYDAARELGGLPAPLQRYFRAVLSDGQPMLAAATITHCETFDVSETAERWKRFTSRQRVVMRRPGFVWDGKVALLPGLAVRVHDAYVATRTWLGAGCERPSAAGDTMHHLGEVSARMQDTEGASA